MQSGVGEIVVAEFLRRHVAMYLLMRIGARLLLVSPYGWAPMSHRYLLAGAFIGYDLASAWAIHTGRLRSMGVRWLLDVADVTICALLCPRSTTYTAVVAVAVPTIAVLAGRRGLLDGFVAGVALAGVVAAARAVAGGQTHLVDTAGYLALAVVTGFALPRIMLAEYAHQRGQARSRAEADLVATRLAGRNDVLTGAGADAIDDLQVSTMKLTAAGVDAAAALRRAVGQHKQRLAEQTRHNAMYLRVALDTYAARVRAVQPAVARHVFFDVAGADGTCVLSLGQHARLAAELDRAQLAGTVAVRVRRILAAGGVELEIGKLLVHLPGGDECRIRLPITPIATAVLALYVLTASNPAHTALSPLVTLPLAAGIIGYAWLGMRLLHRFGTALDPWFAVSSLLPFLLVAFVTAGAPSGRGEMMLLGPLIGEAVVLGTVVRPRMAVVSAWVALATAAVVTVLSAPPLPTWQITAELIWPTVAYFVAFFVSRDVVRINAVLSSQETAQQRAAIADSRRQASQQEITYLLDVLAQGERLCAEAETGPIRDRVRDELAGIRGRLETMRRNLG